MCEYGKVPNKALRQHNEKGRLIAEWIEIDNTKPIKEKNYGKD